jgi:phage shock protein A
MGIFTRMRDIVSSNINAMLDRAEDPEKLIRLMIQEMEDTLVEIKASCAGAMAEAKKIERELDGVRQRVDAWADKAGLAVERGREDLAREALVEKRRLARRAEGLEAELGEARALVGRYQDDIMQLEDKLAAVREKERMLKQRHLAARQQARARRGVREAGSHEAVQRFERFQNRVERLEAEAELVNYGQPASDLDDRFAELESDEEIERELAALKDRQAPHDTQAG